MRVKVKDKIDTLIKFESEQARKPKDDLGLAGLMLNESGSAAKLINIETQQDQTEYGRESDSEEDVQLNFEDLTELEESHKLMKQESEQDAGSQLDQQEELQEDGTPFSGL